MISFVFLAFSFAFSLGWAMPRECCSSTSYIIGGKDTDIKEVPYIATLFYKNGFTCGATIVSEKYLLTAAHCLYRRNHACFTIRVGSPYREVGGVVYKIKKALPNSNFTYSSLDYDVGVLEVEEPIKFNENTKPIGIVDEEPKGGEMSKISGFGQNGPGSLPKQLQSVEIPIYDREECDKTAPISITPRMICTFSEGECKSAFRGDSGGPIVVKGKVAGAVSWGNPNKPGRSPNGYANFADPSIRAFIRKETGL